MQYQPSPDDEAHRVICHVVVECEEALETPDSETWIHAAVHDGLVELATLGVDDPSTQLRAIEFEADRMSVYGVERIRSRLAYVRALLKL